MAKNMKSISVTARMGERIGRAAEERGMAMGGLVEAACESVSADLHSPEAQAFADRVWANMPQTSRIKHGG